MVCYILRNDAGSEIGRLCGNLGDPCTQCGDIAGFLCDFPIADEERTCDRALCGRCAPPIGANKNYCAEHLALGPGLLLFRREQRPDELSVVHERGMNLLTGRAKRLPKAPPKDHRWRVIHSDGSRLSLWLLELEAYKVAKRLRLQGGDAIVQTWGDFVAAWRKVYPLKKRRARVASGNKPHVTLDGEDPRVQGGVKGICHADTPPPLEDRDR